MIRNKYCALALFSGGLDSILSVLYMKKSGYEIIPVFFQTLFFDSEKARKAAKTINIDLLVIDITAQYLEMMKKPRYGFGKNINPCIDCHGLMFRESAKLMKQYNVDFLISGEVLGQRSMSQRSDALNSVAKLSNVKDLIIRPLSQKLLQDTKPIRDGWVKKDEMLDIQGRGRHKQIQMAKEFQVNEYSNPGGGCLLTDIQYSIKLKDLIDHDMFTETFIKFLKYGRHFRLNEKVKLIIGRNDDDNENLTKLITDEVVLKNYDLPGPLAIIHSKYKLEKEDIEKAASILLRYNNKVDDKAVVVYGENFNLENKIEIYKMDNEEVRKFQI